LPCRHPRIEQELERVQITRLALAIERHPAIQPRMPARETPEPQFSCQEVSVTEVDFRDIEIKERFSESDGVPETDDDRAGPDQDREEVADSKRPPLDLPGCILGGRGLRH